MPWYALGGSMGPSCTRPGWRRRSPSALALVTPVTATVAGERWVDRTAAVETAVVVDATAPTQVLAAAPRWPDPSAVVPATRVLAAHEEATHEPAEPEHEPAWEPTSAR